MRTITANSIEQFFQAQRLLKKAGYKLENYDEYFGFEVWQAGSKAVKLQLEE